MLIMNLISYYTKHLQFKSPEGVPGMTSARVADEECFCGLSIFSSEAHIVSSPTRLPSFLLFGP